MGKKVINQFLFYGNCESLLSSISNMKMYC